MPQLHIDLQDGFEREHVVVLINGETVVDDSNVSTRTQIGVAKSIRHDVEAGPVNVEVLVKSRNVRWQRELQIAEPAYLGLSLTSENQVSERTSTAPFRYL